MSVLGLYRYLIRPTAGSDERRSIAVLPFVNSTGDSNQEYLADGITENVINNLSELSSLRVIGRSSVFRYKGRDVQPAEVARELGVEALITGDIKQIGNERIININLIDPKDGSQVWGRQFERSSLDVVETPNEITQAVVQRLSLKLNAEESQLLSALPTQNSDAYKLYLQGSAAGQEFTKEGMSQAIQFDRKAIEKDPSFALAYSDIGMRYADLGIYFVAPDEAMPEATKAANKALLIDPTLREPHIVLGLVALMYDWNWDKANDELIEGASVNLKAIETFNCTAHVLQMTGKTSDADADLRRALKNDPFSKTLITELGCNSYYARRYDDSISEYRDSLAIDPGNFSAVFGLARTQNQVGKYQEAVDGLNNLFSTMPEGPDIGIAERAYANAKMGNRPDAEDDLRLLEKRSEGKYVDPFLYAVVYVGMDDKENALNSLDKAFAVRSSLLPSLVKDAKWDPIRDDARFQALIQKIGFKQAATVSQ
jgi:TolB-like protein